MKVLQVINSLSAGGAEKMVVDISIKLKTLGFKVTIITLEDQPSPFAHRLLDFPEITLVSLGKNDIYSLKNIVKLAKYFKGYDIVHIHLFPSVYWAAFSKFIFRIKTPFIFTEHNTTNRRRKHPVLKLIDQLVYHQFAKIITVSDAADQNLRSHLGHYIQQRIEKIYNGVNFSEIEVAQPYPKTFLELPENAKAVIQVSSFTSQKNQQALIKAATLLDPDTYILLVGDGPTRKSCEELATNLGITHKVKFLGIRNDVPNLLKSAEVVVLSSHYEGLSLASLEGMASGKPFIASKVPGLTEIVNGAGLLFENGNFEELASKINALLQDEDHSFEVAQNCASRAQEYSIDKTAINYTHVYKNSVVNPRLVNPY